MAHIYEKDGKEYPSVTTIIKLISTTESLMQWANFMGFKRRNLKVIKEETTSFGTYLHSTLEWTVLGKKGNLPYHDNPIYQYRALKSLEAFHDTMGDLSKWKTVQTEMQIISERLGYAGTLDWLVSHQGTLFLCDFKSSKNAHDTMFLQLGGYYNLLLEEGYDPDAAMIITCNDVNGCHRYPIDKKQLQHYGEMFLLLLSFYLEWEKHHQPKYIGLEDLINTPKTAG